MGKGTTKGGARRQPEKCLSIRTMGAPKGGTTKKLVTYIAAHGRRYRRSQQTIKGSNPKGEAAGRRARAEAQE